MKHCYSVVIMKPHTLCVNPIPQDMSFDTFADIKLGQELLLMHGTVDNLESRIVRCAKHVMREASFNGAYVICCISLKIASC